MFDFKSLTKYFRKEEVKPEGLVAIEVGQDGMALVRLVRDGDTVQCPISQFTRGISQQDFADSLNSTVEQFGLKGADCVWVLHPNDYRLLTIDRPSVPPSEYAAASQWLIKDLIDYPVESAVLDAFEPASSLTSQKNKLNVVVAQREYLKTFKSVIDEAGLNVVKITIQEIALRNLLMLSEKQPAAMLKIGDSRSLIMVCEQDLIIMMRTINLGLRQIESGQQDSARLIEEEQRSLRYYAEQLRQKKPEAIYVAPLLQANAELIAALNAAMIETFNIDQYCQFAGEVSADDKARVLGCLGAAWPQGVGNG